MRKVPKTMLNRATNYLSKTSKNRFIFPPGRKLTNYHAITTGLGFICSKYVHCRHD